jgi:hypothetical protein
MPQDKKGEYLVCPHCGSIFVDYDHNQKRYRCLVWDCRWMMENECAPDDTSALMKQGEFRRLNFH